VSPLDAKLLALAPAASQYACTSNEREAVQTQLGTALNPSEGWVSALQRRHVLQTVRPVEKFSTGGLKDTPPRAFSCSSHLRRREPLGELLQNVEERLDSAAIGKWSTASQEADRQKAAK